MHITDPLPVCVGCSQVVEMVAWEYYDGRLWHPQCAAAFRKREREARFTRRKRR